MELELLESLALGSERAEAVAQLIPGTEDYYFYSCLLHQQRGELDQVAPLLDTWVKRHGETTRVRQIRDRQALLAYPAARAESLEYLRRRLGLTFDHQRELEGARTDYPTRLDPSEFDRDAFKRDALEHRSDLGGFTDRALPWLVREEVLDATRRRALLSRLLHPDYSGLAALIAEDLADKRSGGFGSLAVHGLLTQRQLDELSTLRPRLHGNAAFVQVYLSRLAPSADVDWRNDAESERAYLDTLRRYVDTLGAGFSSLKANVLYHGLDFDRRHGAFDHDRFMTYLRLPRVSPHTARKHLESHRRDQAELHADYSAYTQLPPIGDDGELVCAYLAHFFLEAEHIAVYEPYLQSDYLERVFAETKILAGAPDPERWYTLLDSPSYYQQLKDRVDLDLAVHNRRHFDADEPVVLEIGVKNVPVLVVKVFEINTLSYFATTGREVTTSVDLDGLVANEEHTREFDHSALALHRERFELSSLARPGTYVVEFIGNGKSSRALVRKGTLRYIERTGAAGHVLTILNEANEVLTDASVWLAGREYESNDEGVVRIPYSSNPGQTKILLRRGDITTLESFDHRAETYRFSCGIYVDREQLRAGGTAVVALRPSLRVGDVPVKVALVNEPSLEISSTDRAGTSASITIPIELHDAAETTHTFQVPPDLTSLLFTLRGKVRSVTQQRDISVIDSSRMTINQIDTSDRTAGIHLSRTSAGYVLYVLGKTGETRAGVAVNVELQHRDFTTARTISLQTDERGRVELGALPDIGTVEASIGSGSQGTWRLERDACRHPSTIHLPVGATVALPHMGTHTSAGDVLSLLECRGGGYLRACTDAAQLRNGLIEIAGLTAGDYHLFLREDGRRILIRITDGTVARGWALSERRLLQLRNPAPLQISAIEPGPEELVVRLVNASTQTRVHVFATRYVSSVAVRAVLDGGGWPEPASVVVHKGLSHYVSGRDIGDEYRYILERKRARVFAGNMLERPSLLLNPWEVRGTSTSLDEAAEGGEYDRSAERSMRRMEERDAERGADDSEWGTGPGDHNIDFLASPSHVELNLGPDADGVVRIPRSQLAGASLVRIVALDSFNAVMRQCALGEVSEAARDLTLQDGLGAHEHFAEKKQHTCLTADSELRIEDIRTSTVEVYDSVGRAFGLLQTLSANETLREFDFIVGWPELSDQDKRAKYSEYACHELSLFLHFKDRPFFDEVIEPYLRHKQHKTFLDAYLIGDDLRGYLQPWQYGRLNVVERILLAVRIESERGPTGRHVKDLFDLLPPDVDRTNRLFRTALLGSALDTEDALGFVKAKKKAKKKPRRRAREQRTGAMPPPAPGAPSPAAPKMVMPEPASFAAGAAAASEPMPMEMVMSMSAEMEEESDDDYLARDEIRRFYRKLDKTKEWAENNYYKLRITAQTADLVRVNPFWRDYAAHVASGSKGPFLSGNLLHATGNFTEMMCALAVLDLPFVKGKHEVAFSDAVMTLRAAAEAVIFHKEIKPAEPSQTRIPVLVSQNYFRADDRYRWEENERYEKYVTGEMLAHVVYLCQVVLTNPSSSPYKLDLLMQIPEGAMPVSSGFVTQGKHVDVQPHDTHMEEYAFYFPRPGEYEHFPVHVSRNEQLVAVADPTPIRVVAELSAVDTESWSYVSQRGDSEQVLAYLRDNNIDRLDLDRIAWRMRDRGFYEAVLSLLAERHVYQPALWSYSIHHDDAAGIRTLLEHSDSFLRGCGKAIASPLVDINPTQRRWHEHLEYAPLVNARAHRLGGVLKILNDAFLHQYEAFLHALTYEASPTSGQLLAATYYLLLQDRIEDALDMFDRVDESAIAATLQYDYVRGFVALYREEPGIARDVAERHKEHPVDRWRKRFQNMLVVLEEVEGAAATVVDEDDALQEQTRLATTQAGFDFSVEGHAVTVSYQNLRECTVNYYLMDIELLFSRQPFMEDPSDRFSIVRPNTSDSISLSADAHELTFDIPAEYRSRNTIIEIVADGVRRSLANYAHQLLVQLVHQYGQLRVYRRGTNKPLAQTYVKVYARRDDGSVTFYKDGYTDLRGAFDYASLSTDELDHVERFAMLIVTGESGAVIREASPPGQ